MSVLERIQRHAVDARYGTTFGTLLRGPVIRGTHDELVCLRGKCKEDKYFYPEQLEREGFRFYVAMPECWWFTFEGVEDEKLPIGWPAKWAFTERTGLALITGQEIERLMEDYVPSSRQKDISRLIRPLLAVRKREQYFIWRDVALLGKTRCTECHRVYCGGYECEKLDGRYSGNGWRTRYEVWVCSTRCAHALTKRLGPIRRVHERVTAVRKFITQADRERAKRSAQETLAQWKKVDREADQTYPGLDFVK